MLNFLVRRRIAAFERTYGYDMSYARAILQADTGAFLKLNGVMGLSSWHRGVPRAAYFAAKIAATAAEDCGPCTQLILTMAARAGVSAAVLRAIVTGDQAAMGEDAALGWRFARASLARSADASALRDAVTKRWGERAVISLAYAITSGRLFPTLKYALGHGIACVSLHVEGETIPVARAA